MSFRTITASLFALLVSFAAGCATTTPTSRCASYEAWDETLVVCVPLGFAGAKPLPSRLVAGATLNALEANGYGAGLKPSTETVEEIAGPRAPLYTYERQLVVNKRPQAVASHPLAGMVDDDVLQGAYYAGRKVPEGAGEVVKTTPNPAAK